MTAMNNDRLFRYVAMLMIFLADLLAVTFVTNSWRHHYSGITRLAVYLALALLFLIGSLVWVIYRLLRTRFKPDGLRFREWFGFMVGGCFLAGALWPLAAFILIMALIPESKGLFSPPGLSDPPSRSRGPTSQGGR